MTFDEKALLVFDIFKSFLPDVKNKESILMSSKKITFFINNKYSKKCHQVCIVIKEEMEKDSIRVDFIFWPRERTIKDTNFLVLSSKEEIKKDEEQWVRDQALLASKHIGLLRFKKPVIAPHILKSFSLRSITLSN